MNSNKTESSLTWWQRVLYSLTNWGFFITGVANLIIGTWWAVNGQVAGAAVSLTAGLVLLFAATIDRFESLKGLGIEAKTRQLDRKIEEADEAVRRLKELAELTGAALVDLNSRTGRWDSAPGPRESFVLAQRVRSILAALGSEPSVIHNTLRPWAKLICFELASALVDPLREELTTKIRKLEGQRGAIPKPINPSNPEFLQLSSEITAGYAFQQHRLENLYRLQLEDYPENFLNLFEDVPLVDDQALAPIRAKAHRFASDMFNLRQTYTFVDPEPWFVEIEDARNRKT